MRTLIEDDMLFSFFITDYLIKEKQQYIFLLKKLIYLCYRVTNHEKRNDMKRLKWIWFVIPILFACVSKNDRGDRYSDLEKVIMSDTLRVVTLSRSTSYFDYQGNEMGYEYELAQQLAHSLNVKLKVVTARDENQMLELLKKGNVDVIAYPVTISPEMKEQVDFVAHEYKTKQVLVQRKSKKKSIVKDALELIDKEVYVVENSKYHKHLLKVDEEIGGGILIQTVSNEEDEETLIEKVSKGEIPYTIADENIASINKTYFNNIDIKMGMSHSQRSAWAVRKGSTSLRDTINSWFSEIQGDFTYQYLHNKYFEHKKKYAQDVPKYINSKKISDFDPLFKKYANTIRWDWKMLASIAYQESRFNPNAKSWAGAVGIMQLMPNTAKRFGVDSTGIVNPEQNIKAAVKYLDNVDGAFKYIEDEDERTKFVLASYNAGVGHVRDAMALAEKHGKSPDKWCDVRVFMLMKAKPEFFNDPVVRHGYLRGEETDNFVTEIMLRYKEYNDVIID